MDDRDTTSIKTVIKDEIKTINNICPNKNDNSIIFN